MNNLINRHIHRDLVNWNDEGGGNNSTEIEPKEKISWWKKLINFFLCRSL